MSSQELVPIDQLIENVPEEILPLSMVPYVLPLLRAMVGEATQEFGLLLADQVHTARIRLGLRRLPRTHEMLEEAGIDPGSVPLKTLVPAFEGAALEDDVDLNERWSALLANAAGGDEAAAVLPSFPHALQQLSAHDAVILDHLFQAADEGRGDDGWIQRADIRDDLELSPAEFLDIVLDNLRGLGLVDFEPSARVSPDGYQVMTDQQGVQITSYGRRFVLACRAPTQRKG